MLIMTNLYMKDKAIRYKSLQDKAYLGKIFLLLTPIRKVLSSNMFNFSLKFYMPSSLQSTAKSLPNTAQNAKFSTADLVTFTEEILNGKLHFLCSGMAVILT